jgi:hypothetical protein
VNLFHHRDYLTVTRRASDQFRTLTGLDHDLKRFVSTVMAVLRAGRAKLVSEDDNARGRLRIVRARADLWPAPLRLHLIWGVHPDGTAQKSPDGRGRLVHLVEVSASSD